MDREREREREGRKLYKEGERETHTYRDGQRERERDREYTGLGERGTDRQTEKEDTQREKWDWIGREIEKGDMIGRDRKRERERERERERDWEREKTSRSEICRLSTVHSIYVQCASVMMTFLVR